MKHLLFVVLIILIAFPISAMSDDDVSFFIDKCTADGLNSKTYCECASKAYSKKIMKKDRTRLKSFDSKIAYQEKQILTLDPAMTKSKIDQVYALYVPIRKLQTLSMAGEREKYSVEIDSLKKEQQDLIKRLTDNQGIVRLFAKNRYFKIRYKADQIREDLSGYDEVAHDFVIRTTKPNTLYTRILNLSRRSGCRK